MGYALLQGLARSGYPPEWLCGADSMSACLARLESLEIRGCASNREAVADAGVVILAVKPAQITGVLREISGALPPHTLLLSVAAGIDLQTLETLLPQHTPVVRVMPNTPARIGAGITALSANANLAPRLRQLTEGILGSFGPVLWITPEELMDVVTALSGSGPAYFFYFLECLERAAVELGLPAAQARLLARYTALGAASMSLEEEGIDLAELRRTVTSPGGTTEAALHEFQKAGLAAITRHALRAAQGRAHSLTKCASE